MAVSKRLRFEILRRDGFRCTYCGATAAEAELRVDHVIPEALGGTDDPTNLTTACDPCNSGKSATHADAPIVAAADAAAERWAHAIAAVAAQRTLADAAVCQWFKPIWFAAAAQQGHFRWLPLAMFESVDPVTDVIDERGRVRVTIAPRPTDWIDTVARLLALGLTRDAIERYVHIAMRRDIPHEDRWRYFCGCCWAALRETHAAARRLIDAGQVT